MNVRVGDKVVLVLEGAVITTTVEVVRPRNPDCTPEEECPEDQHMLALETAQEIMVGE